MEQELWQDWPRLPKFSEVAALFSPSVMQPSESRQSETRKNINALLDEDNSCGKKIMWWGIWEDWRETEGEG